MAFSVSGGIITQTGTDANLTGLAGLAGVTSENFGRYTRYTLNSTTRLVINGTLSFNVNNDTGFEQLCFNFSARTANALYIAGSLTIGSDRAEIRHRYANFNPAILEVSGVLDYAQSWSATNNGQGSGSAFGSVYVESGGALTLYGNAIVLGGGLGVHPSGSILVKNGRIVCNLAYFYGNSSFQNLEITSDIENLVGFLLVKPPSLLSGLVSRSSAYVSVSNLSNFGDIFNIENIPALGEQVAVDGGKVNDTLPRVVVNLINGATGSNYIINSPDRYYICNIYKRVYFSLKAPSGIAIPDVFVYLKGSTPTSIYTEISNTSGATNLISVQLSNHIRFGTTKTDAFYSLNSNNEDIFLVRFFSYLHTFSLPGNVTLKGVNNLLIESVLVSDPNITEANKTLVNAYTEINTLERLYDRSKSWQRDNFATAFPSVDSLICAANGSELDLQNINLVVDATASNAYSVNTSDNRVTIKCSSILSGSKFNTIRTTGTIIFQNGASYDVTIIDSTGTRLPPVLLSITNIVPNSEVIIKISGTSTQLLKSDVVGTSISYSYSNQQIVDIAVYKEGYQAWISKGFELPATSQSIQAQQALSTAWRS